MVPPPRWPPASTYTPILRHFLTPQGILPPEMVPRCGFSTTITITTQNTHTRTRFCRPHDMFEKMSYAQFFL